MMKTKQTDQGINLIQKKPTEAEVSKIKMARPANTTERTKKDIITALGVRIGCHAGNLCCLKAVSRKFQTRQKQFKEISFI